MVIRKKAALSDLQITNKCYINNVNRGENISCSGRFRIRYVDVPIDPVILAHLINKEILKDAVYNNLSAEKIKENILIRLKKGKVKLWNLKNGKEEWIDLSNISRILFFHNKCSPCELKSLIPRFQMEQIIQDKMELIVFSFNSNLSDLEMVLSSESINTKIFYDYIDEFSVAFCMTFGSSPVTIELKPEGGNL